jgi:SAM-dependent methyltransferase
VKQGEAENLPYEDKSFDLVTGLDVVEHLDDDLAGLKEMHRVLRPSGRALVFRSLPSCFSGESRTTLAITGDVIHSRKSRMCYSGRGSRLKRATYANITVLRSDSARTSADANHRLSSGVGKQPNDRGVQRRAGKNFRD